MVEIIPSILTNNPAELEQLMHRAQGIVERVQIDIIDGKFADNKTIDPSAVGEINTTLKLDFHLMVEEPIHWVEKCAQAGADRIIAQIEKMSDQAKYIGKVRETEAQVGLAIDLETKASELDGANLDNLDVVLVMSVAAGFGGQKFDKRAVGKIRVLQKIRSKDKIPFRICDDGGITLNWTGETHFAGADEVSIGRRFFKGDLAKNLDKFQRAAHKLNLESK